MREEFERLGEETFQKELDELIDRASKNPLFTSTYQ